jgi:hypothetical protein
MVKMIKWLIAAGCAAIPALTGTAQVTVAPLLQPHQFSANPSNGGGPCAGCQLFSYLAGSTTPQPTYTYSTVTTENTNPSGMANIWIAGSGYKFVL